MQEMFGVRYLRAHLPSGTAAVHTALAALGVTPGDEVITTPVTDHGTVIGIMQLNAIPVFADVNPKTMMIDAGTIEPHITSRTRVILPCTWPAARRTWTVSAAWRKSGLKVLEDCAQSWMAEWNGRLGAPRGMPASSPSTVEHISAGEGAPPHRRWGDRAAMRISSPIRATTARGQGPVDR